MKDVDVLNFQFEEVEDELDVSNCIGKYFLWGCFLRESLVFYEFNLFCGEGYELGMCMKFDDK